MKKSDENVCVQRSIVSMSPYNLGSYKHYVIDNEAEAQKPMVENGGIRMPVHLPLT